RFDCPPWEGVFPLPAASGPGCSGGVGHRLGNRQCASRQAHRLRGAVVCPGPGPGGAGAVRQLQPRHPDWFSKTTFPWADTQMTEARSRYSAPLQVLLMIGIIAATIVLGFFMMPDTSEERDRLLGELGTTNHGTFLVPVRDLAELPLRDGAGAAVDWREGKPKWRLLI